MSEKIAFIGVGNMGNPMAVNLLKAGNNIKVFDVSKKMLEKAKEKNLETKDSIEDFFVKNNIPVIILMFKFFFRNVFANIFAITCIAKSLKANVGP